MAERKRYDNDALALERMRFELDSEWMCLDYVQFNRQEAGKALSHALDLHIKYPNVWRDDVEQVEDDEEEQVWLDRLKRRICQKVFCLSDVTDEFKYARARGQLHGYMRLRHGGVGGLTKCAAKNEMP